MVSRSDFALYTLRFAILLLPWQTRFIWGMVQYPAASYQPEWGIYAVYASWIVIPLAWLLSPVRHLERSREISFSIKYLVILVLITLGLSPYGLQWLVQLGVLLLLADAIRRNSWSRETLVSWFVASLIPEALLAFWQYGAQQVFAFKWLGISAQMPVDAGVSVIQYGSDRILRAYAGFPHPNIAGIWFALGLAASLWLIKMSHVKWQMWLGWFMSIILPFALILTFSRSAWLAAIMLLIGCIWKLRSRALAFSLVCLALASVFVAPQILSRASSGNRLETTSVTEREASWTRIWPLIGQSPLIGYGVGSSVRVMNEAGLGAQPPHALPLIILLELGICGFLIAGQMFHVIWKMSDGPGRWLLVSLLPSALLDHYFYSLWAGISLLTLAIIFSISLDKTQKTS